MKVTVRVRPVLMNHADRQKLITAPITFRVYGSTGRGGVTFHSDVPVEGRHINRRQESSDEDALSCIEYEQGAL